MTIEHYSPFLAAAIEAKPCFVFDEGMVGVDMETLPHVFESHALGKWTDEHQLLLIRLMPEIIGINLEGGDIVWMLCIFFYECKERLTQTIQ